LAKRKKNTRKAEEKLMICGCLVSPPFAFSLPNGQPQCAGEPGITAHEGDMAPIEAFSLLELIIFLGFKLNSRLGTVYAHFSCRITSQ
jgi:hypothetical protein